MLTRREILHLFDLLNEECATRTVHGELYLVGGAVMCLALNARPATCDIDAMFRPSSEIRTAANHVARKAHVDEGWLNDAVKGFLSPQGMFEPYLDLSHLKVFVAQADYLLAMKCMAMGLGAEFHDLEDVRYLIRNLNITKYKEVMRILEKYYPLKAYPQKTLHVLEELLV